MNSFAIPDLVDNLTSPGLKRILTSAAIIAKKLKVLIKKHEASPTDPISIPAIVGPIILAPWKADELSAMAFNRLSFPTISIINDCLAGISKA